MKRVVFGVALLALAGLQTIGAAPLVINFASDDGGTINFDGLGNFSFPNTGTFDFHIISTSGGTGSANGLQGNISNNPFTIGAITTNGPLETAPVTGSATLTIDDGTMAHNLFTGTLTWISISSLGASGSTNFNAEINLSNLSYSGTNVDLLTLGNSPAALVTGTYQFTGPTDLNFLKTHADSTSYSGSITPVPEPAFVGLALVGLNGLLLTIHRRRRAS